MQLRRIVIWLIGVMALAVTPLQAAEFSPKVNSLEECPGSIFTQAARVFGVLLVCATDGVPAVKLEHAARVAGAWLDNDLDGRADEPRLIARLRTAGAIVVMSHEGFPDGILENALADEDPDQFVFQDLAAVETMPASGRDATQEEIHHIIVNAGWSRLFPNTFGDQTDSRSTMVRLWQKAEAGGHYSYNDETCDAACKSVEFHYLAAAAYLGSDADLETDEMLLKSRAELRAALPGIIKVFESSWYHYPRHHWPDGQYRFDKVIAFNP